MVGSRKPVPSATKTILTGAIAAALVALALVAAVFDQQTETGNVAQRLFATLIGLTLGPAPILAAIGALVATRRPHNPLFVPVVIATLLFGAAMTWLFFVETIELPRLWP